MAQGVKKPKKNLPRGILLTFVIATFLNFIVVSGVVLEVPMVDLKNSAAPLRPTFENTGTLPTIIFGVIANFVTINWMFIMASRVINGLASQENLHTLFAYINPMTRTPLIAAFFVMGVVFLLAYFSPIGRLAETTSIIVLLASGNRFSANLKFHIF